MATLTELASKVPDKERFPVAIIGAGLGGLMAGACLSRNGFPVTVFERYDKPGGYATTFSGGRLPLMFRCMPRWPQALPWIFCWKPPG